MCIINYELTFVYWNLYVITGRQEERIQFYCIKRHKTGSSLDVNPAFSTRHSLLLNRSLFNKVSRRHSVNFSNQLRSDYMHVEPSNIQHSNEEIIPPIQSDQGEILASPDATNNRTLHVKPKMYKNRFLNFVRLSSVLNGVAESFFKSEIRRRLFVTSVLIIVSRIGYFIPLPGFDRRLIPQDYLSFVSGSVGKLHT